MARYQAILTYDGRDFFGSQRQATSRTAQGELEKALRQIGWIGTSVIMAGRTDAGVHALGQSAAFDFPEWKASPTDLLRALNAKMPADLAARKIVLVRADFHPRFDALSRLYHYRLFCDSIRDPLRERTAWRVQPTPNDETLRLAANLLLGTHDFAAFGSAVSEKGTTIRTVLKSEWKKKPNGERQFEVRADAFLYRMVRRLIFVQVAAAQRRCSLEDIRRALESGQGQNLPAGLAPARGLSLMEVEYENR